MRSKTNRVFISQFFWMVWRWYSGDDSLVIAR